MACENAQKNDGTACKNRKIYSGGTVLWQVIKSLKSCNNELRYNLYIYILKKNSKPYLYHPITLQELAIYFEGILGPKAGCNAALHQTV